MILNEKDAWELLNHPCAEKKQVARIADLGNTIFLSPTKNSFLLSSVGIGT